LHNSSSSCCRYEPVHGRCLVPVSRADGHGEQRKERQRNPSMGRTTGADQVGSWAGSSLTLCCTEKILMTGSLCCVLASLNAQWLGEVELYCCLGHYMFQGTTGSR
jgi:hypothetical protein